MNGTDSEGLRRMVTTMLGEASFTRPWRRDDGDARCHECGRLNSVWWVQHEVWNMVMAHHREAIVCVTCFIVHAEAIGIGRTGAWQLYPPSPLT